MFIESYEGAEAVEVGRLNFVILSNHFRVFQNWSEDLESDSEPDSDVSMED